LGGGQGSSGLATTARDHDHVHGVAGALARVQIAVDREVVDDLVVVVQAEVELPLGFGTVAVTDLVLGAGIHPADDQHGAAVVLE
jgi:hypothetical protein